MRRGNVDTWRPDIQQSLHQQYEDHEVQMQKIQKENCAKKDKRKHDGAVDQATNESDDF
jgi:hypothetical protein